ncbi:hypothetical protein SAMN05421505_106112 [Sinosporangium album]|uniref:Secreted protein n=1 Tax=Sinosporangium album TaxID=504805 RepID=A0A1G7VYJ2_9ACTN|nr:DUF5719 family protein [Sinosporangium album]SDG64741.1 hypothetical protein SAMN05421505_106112 [Sinosporangium album]
MKALIENRFTLLVLVTVALLATCGLAAMTQPIRTAGAAAPAAPTRAPVESVTTVCPPPEGGAVSVVVPSLLRGTPGAPAADTPGPAAGVVVTELGKLGEATVTGNAHRLATLTRHGQVWQRSMDGGVPVQISGTGEMAGLESAYTALRTTGKRRGLSGVRCGDAASGTWLIGPGPAAAEVTLHLTNPGPAPATAEVFIYSGDGPVYGEIDGDTAVALRPGETRAVDVADLAPRAVIAALSVRAVSGRVVAAAEAVLDRKRGVDWLPEAAAPATRVVVPGVPGGGGGRELLVAAPGEIGARVDVRVLTSDGLKEVEGGWSLDVPAGSVVAMDLSGAFGTRSGAVVVTSQVPVVAGLVAVGTGKRKDAAFTAGALPIDFGSIVADNRTGGEPAGRQSSHLVLSAPQTEGRLWLQLVPSEGPPTDVAEVHIPAASTVDVELPHPKGASSPFAVVVTPLPGSGPIYGGRVLTGRDESGLMFTVQPLAAARSWTVVPTLTESSATVLP